MKMGDLTTGQLAIIHGTGTEVNDGHLVSKSWQNGHVNGVSVPMRCWGVKPGEGLPVEPVPENASILLVPDGRDTHAGDHYPKYKVIILPDFKLP
jgi:hypothetical protein